MAATGIQWGAWSGKARLGVNFRWDDIGAGTMQSHVYADVYYGTNTWGFDGNYTLICTFGNVGFHFYSASGASVTTLINTYDLGVQNTSLSGGPSWTCNVSLNTPLYNGNNPTASVGFTLPARPGSLPPAPPYAGNSAISQDSVSISWSNPGGSPAVDLYEWHVWDASHSWASPNASGQTTAGTVNVGGLWPSTRYYWGVMAHNSLGWGSPSNTGTAWWIATLSGAAVKVAGTWRTAKVWVRAAGTWRLAKVWKRAGGTWRL